MIELIRGDITTIHVDAIVNAANSSLLGGGGVDGAIHRAGGPAILEACREINRKQGGCSVGEAVLTTAGKLPASYVIHTVGPVWHGGQRNEERHLSNAYRNSLKLAMNERISTMSFPNISTGVYSYPKDKAAYVAIRTVQNFMEQHRLPEKVIFVCFDEENYKIYMTILKK